MAEVFALRRDEKLRLPEAARRNVHVTLSPRASSIVLAFCRDEGLDVGEALSEIVCNWADTKYAALEAAASFGRSAQDACQEGVKGA